MPANYGQTTMLHAARAGAIATWPSAAAFRPRPYYSSSVVGSAGFTADPILGQASFSAFDTPALARDMEEVAGDIVYPLCANGAGDIFADLFGAPSTVGASAPFTHVFLSGRPESPKIMAAELRLSSTHQRRLIGLVPTGFKLDVAKEASGDTTQRLTVSYMGREDQLATTALTGIGTARTAAFQNRRKVALLIDNVVVGEVLTASVDHKTGVASVPFLDGDDLTGAIERDVDESCSGSIRVRTNARTWHEMSEDGVLRTITLRWGTSNSGVTVSVLAKIAKTGQPVEGRGALLANFDFMGQVGASNSMVTVAVINALPADTYA